MNRDEAIAIIRKEYLCVDRDCDIERNCGKCDLMMPSKEPILQAYKMALKALEQEPCRYWQNGKCNGNTEVCEDAISRQAVQDYIAKYLSQYLYNDVREAVEVIDEYIGELPSVTPQPKTGHWEQYGNSWEDKFKCSECGKEQPKILCGERIIGHWSDYCPNCGCRMVEPQERNGEE